MLRTALALVFLTGTASADDFSGAIRQFYDAEVQRWANSPVLVKAILDQNLRTTGYDQARIDQLDGAWRSEIGAADRPTITPVLKNPASDFLRDQVIAYSGRITEVFIVDARGLNVAASDVTSDYWQGDEAKFTETFSKGAGAVHVDDVELDQSTQRYQGQVSATISDPATGRPIGAITVGVDAESVM